MILFPREIVHSPVFSHRTGRQLLNHDAGVVFAATKPVLSCKSNLDARLKVGFTDACLAKVSRHVPGASASANLYRQEYRAVAQA
jgi:hypothetical protein